MEASLGQMGWSVLSHSFVCQYFCQTTGDTSYFACEVRRILRSLRLRPFCCARVWGSQAARRRRVLSATELVVCPAPVGLRGTAAGRGQALGCAARAEAWLSRAGGAAP